MSTTRQKHWEALALVPPPPPPQCLTLDGDQARNYAPVVLVIWQPVDSVSREELCKTCFLSSLIAKLTLLHCFKIAVLQCVLI